jgi:hypothetical protein
VKPGADPGARGRPLDHLFEGRAHSRVLADDLVPQRHRSLLQPAVELVDDLRVAELERDVLQAILFGDGAVPVDSDEAAQKCEVTPAGSSSAFVASLTDSGSSYQE